MEFLVSSETSKLKNLPLDKHLNRNLKKNLRIIISKTMKNKTKEEEIRNQQKEEEIQI